MNEFFTRGAEGGGLLSLGVAVGGCCLDVSTVVGDGECFDGEKCITSIRARYQGLAHDEHKNNRLMKRVGDVSREAMVAHTYRTINESYREATE